MIDVKTGLDKNKVHYSKIAILATAMSLCAAVSGIIFYFWPSALAIIFGLITILIGFIFGISGFVSIRKSEGLLKGRFFSFLGIVIPVLLLIIILFIVLRLKGEIGNFLCQERLYGLRQQLILYSDEYGGGYPKSSEWCDKLKENGCPYKYFKCPSSKSDKCSYAMNPYVDVNAPQDVILLFESASDWNLSGGEELMNTFRHKRKGVNVLFNGGYVDFVPIENFDKLKWK